VNTPSSVAASSELYLQAAERRNCAAIERVADRSTHCEGCDQKMKICSIAFVGSSALVGIACRPTASTGECNASHAIETSVWPTDTAGAFQIRIPSGFDREMTRGIDSEGGGWGRAGARLTYDFGAYSSALTDEPYASGQACTGRIRGKLARVVLARDRDGRFLVGAHWTGFADRGVGPVSLTITGIATDSLARDTLVAMLWTVTFKE
jgi:hypothetical protein